MSDTVKSRQRHRPHWYRAYVGECPVCGRDRSYRLRVYGRRPPDGRKRYVCLSGAETYDHCLERE